MAGSTISAKVTIGITLGSAIGLYTYPSPLTITSGGEIAPSAIGATGLIAAISAGYTAVQR